MTTLYVLRCKGQKFYVGKTHKEVSDRITEHVMQSGSAWTRKHVPVELVETREVTQPDDETRLTKMYMKRYGIDNVRGGAYTKLVFSPEEVEFLEREFAADADLCYTCHQPGHVSSSCTQSSRKKITCRRCGRDSHWTRDCFARTNIRGTTIESDSDDWSDGDDWSDSDESDGDGK